MDSPDVSHPVKVLVLCDVVFAADDVKSDPRALPAPGTIQTRPPALVLNAVSDPSEIWYATRIELFDPPLLIDVPTFVKPLVKAGGVVVADLLR